MIGLFRTESLVSHQSYLLSVPLPAHIKVELLRFLSHDCYRSLKLGKVKCCFQSLFLDLSALVILDFVNQPYYLLNERHIRSTRGYGDGSTLVSLYKSRAVLIEHPLLSQQRVRVVSREFGKGFIIQRLIFVFTKPNPEDWNVKVLFLSGGG